jgi:Uma2 family endonuclease
MTRIPPRSKQPIYPERDGRPLADNTKQFRWVFLLCGNIQAMFHRCLDVFVAADLLWYPVEGEPGVSTAPDVLVVFGRPKGDRGCYKQWEENNIPITVAFEVLSLKNPQMEMTDKHLFYEEHGVEEYYVYDPDSNRLSVYLRTGELLRPLRSVDGFVSPSLGIRFDLSGPEMVVYGPDGQRFLSFEDQKALYDQLQQRTVNAKWGAEKAQEEIREAQCATEKAQGQIREAQRQIAAAQNCLARLTKLSRKARKQLATPEELQELERLENAFLSSP